MVYQLDEGLSCFLLYDCDSWRVTKCLGLGAFWDLSCRCGPWLSMQALVLIWWVETCSWFQVDSHLLSTQFCVFTERLTVRDHVTALFSICMLPVGCILHLLPNFFAIDGYFPSHETLRDVVSCCWMAVFPCQHWYSMAVSSVYCHPLLTYIHIPDFVSDLFSVALLMKS